MNDMTKKLQKMVKEKKKGPVVSAQKDFKPYKKRYNSTSSEAYCYSNN